MAVCMNRFEVENFGGIEMEDQIMAKVVSEQLDVNVHTGDYLDCYFQA